MAVLCPCCPWRKRLLARNDTDERDGVRGRVGDVGDQHRAGDGAGNDAEEEDVFQIVAGYGCGRCH